MNRARLILPGLVGFAVVTVLLGIFAPLIGSQRQWILGNARVLDRAKDNPEAREAAIESLIKRHQEQDARARGQAWILLGLSVMSGVFVSFLMFRTLGGRAVAEQQAETDPDP